MAVSDKARREGLVGPVATRRNVVRDSQGSAQLPQLVVVGRVQSTLERKAPFATRIQLGRMPRRIEQVPSEMVQALLPFEFTEYPPAEMRRRAENFYHLVRKRRSVRDFSERPVPRTVIEQALLAAGTAPSGAHMQPWQFVVVSNPEIKKQIREAAEEEERAFYRGRASQEWLQALEKLGTDANKPFLEAAPYLIVIFLKKFTFDAQGKRHKNYYTTESVGIATGVLITALHNAGLATLTHTPSPMKFLNRILHRPSTERPYLILVVGYPQPGAQVPAIQRYALGEIATFVE